MFNNYKETLMIVNRKTHFIGLRISAYEHKSITEIALCKGKSLSEHLRLIISINILQNKKPKLETSVKLK